MTIIQLCLQFGPERNEGSSFGEADFEFAYALGVVGILGFKVINFDA